MGCSKHGKDFAARRLQAQPSLASVLQYLGLAIRQAEGSHAFATVQDLTSPITNPFRFESDVVLIAVDLEAYERAQHKITEIGVSALDTRDLAALAPGPDGAAWVQQIRTRHFRISEHAKLVNRTFVKGCPDRFSFGTSEWLSLCSANTTLTHLFRIPSSSVTASASPPHRNIVLVGHGLGGDTKYLKALGFSPFAAGTVVGTIDTLKLSGPKQQQLGLKRLLDALGVEPVDLHNAGNDAHYTMRALVHLAIRTLTTSEPLVPPQPQRQGRRATAAVVEEGRSSSNPLLDGHVGTGAVTHATGACQEKDRRVRKVQRRREAAIAAVHAQSEG